MLVIGTSAESVVGYCTGQVPGLAGSRFARFRAAYFPDSQSFAFVDLPRLYDAADAHRDGLARRLSAKHNRPESDARHDLDQALDLIHLFRGAFATSSIEPGFTSMHRSIGLLSQDPTPSPPSSLPRGR